MKTDEDGELSYLITLKKDYRLLGRSDGGLKSQAFFNSKCKVTESFFPPQFCVFSWRVNLDNFGTSEFSCKILFSIGLELSSPGFDLQPSIFFVFFISSSILLSSLSILFWIPLILKKLQLIIGYTLLFRNLQGVPPKKNSSIAENHINP